MWATHKPFALILLVIAVNVINTTSGLGIPPSPHPGATCATVPGPFMVDGYPATPFPMKLFQNIFVNPPKLAPMFEPQCRADGHCIHSYKIDVYEVQKKPFDKLIPQCRFKPGTWFLSYNGQVPGPSIIAATGQESIVRFRNRIAGNYFSGFAPCGSGRPISIHLHGSASISPSDGWAEDVLCPGQTKDYYYPNNRPVTAWYHDHALHTTAANAYYGLAGLHVVSSKLKDGACGEPWNLEKIPELHWVLQDKLLNDQCQLFMNTSHEQGPHEYNFYGDINVLSGIPFPLMVVQPRYYRIRMLNGAVSRPFLIQIRTADGSKEVSSNICKVVATDGGYRHQTAAWSTEGVLIGVGERYEAVCDFSKYAGQTFYLWNNRDTNFMPNVPYFCNSHLVAKIVVNRIKSRKAPVFVEDDITPKPVHHLDKVLSSADIQEARDRIAADDPDRTFTFSFIDTHPYWLVNNNSWESMTIAAEDVGLNSWELWKLNTIEYQQVSDRPQPSGKWFHPVHMHLVDFFVLERQNAAGGVRPYEAMGAKDVVMLFADSTVWLIARFGAHRGDYMFHCHNLVHEDDDMMRAFRVGPTDGSKNAATAERFLKVNDIIYSNWKYADPMLPETAATSSPRFFSRRYAKNALAKNIYRIFYSEDNDPELGPLEASGYVNPWKSKWAPGKC